MQLSGEYRGQLEAYNTKEYGENYHRLRWISLSEARRATGVREELLKSLAAATSLGYKGTKIDCTRLSPGCEICGEGSWSCLFINGLCNCRCFYCPSEQNDVDVPTTNTLPFPKAADYLDYIDRFSFKGVSISGGEPLLTPELTLEYITRVKKRFGERVYLWMYTNGTLLTEDIVLKLEQAGLDEIRFDIGATHYQLEKARLAVGHIRHVTVEIPAVPEDLELMQHKIHEIHEEGIHYLNLHQLRLTPHNFTNLVQRNYTYLHGEKVTVLESELAALNLISHAVESKIDLPINYCSFVYKNRFQRAAARRRSAGMIKKPHEDITEAGYIRQLGLKGEASHLERQIEVFRQRGFDDSLWSMRSGPALHFSEQLWGCIDFTGLTLSVSYSDAILLPAHTYRNQFVEIALNPNRKVIAERARVLKETELISNDIPLFEDLAINRRNDLLLGNHSPNLQEILRHECIPSGLQEYF